MCINEDLPYKERSSLLRYESQLYTAIKTPKPLRINVHIIYSSSNTLELWKFSNLTFGEYLIGTTPVLSARSPLFLFRKFCLKHVKTVLLTDDF